MKVAARLVAIELSAVHVGKSHSAEIRAVSPFRIAGNDTEFVTGVSCVGVFAAGTSASESACFCLVGRNGHATDLHSGASNGRVSVSSPLVHEVPSGQHHVPSFNPCQTVLMRFFILRRIHCYFLTSFHPTPSQPTRPTPDPLLLPGGGKEG